MKQNSRASRRDFEVGKIYVVLRETLQNVGLSDL